MATVFLTLIVSSRGGRSNGNHGSSSENNGVDTSDMDEAARAFAAAWTCKKGDKVPDTRLCDFCGNLPHTIPGAYKLFEKRLVN